jgi:hypothetical protein
MSNFLIAWLVGLSLSIAHEIYMYKVDEPSNANPLPIKPGRVLIASGIYVGLAILAESQSFQSIAVLMAWGYNAAIALKWAQEYSANKAQVKAYPGTAGAASGTAFWNPPSASGDVLFPSGTGSSSQKPMSAEQLIASRANGTGSKAT